MPDNGFDTSISLKKNLKENFEKIISEKAYMFLIGILVITVLVYFNTFLNDFVNMDDYLFVTENPYIQSFSLDNFIYNFTHPTGGHFQPITQISYMVDHAVAGLNPFIYHLSSLILHLINILLVYFLVGSLFKRKDIALLIALLFAIHPVNAETVCWASTRNGLIFVTFYLLALLTYSSYLNEGRKLKYLVFTFLLFLMAVLSKSAAISLPGLLFLFDFYYKRKISIRLFVEKIPFIVVAILGGMGAIWAAKELGSINMSKVTISTLDKFFYLNTSFLFYIYKTIIPVHLLNMHFLPTKSNGFLPFEFYIAPVVNLIILVGIFISKVRRRYYIFGFCFYLISIVLFLQLVQIGGTFASERYGYLPMIGLFLIIGYLYISAEESNINKTFPLKTVFSLGLLFLVFFSTYQTFNRVKVWENGESLFTDYIMKEPGFEYGYWGRSGYYLFDRRYEDAEEDINKAIELSPFDPRCRFQRGVLKSILTQYEGAIEDFDIAISNDSSYAKAYKSRAYAKLMLSRFEESITDYNLALLHDSKMGNSEYYFYLGSAKQNVSDYQGAISAFDQSISMNYDTLFKAYYNRGNAKMNLSLYSEAILDYNEAITLNTNCFDAFNNKGVCYYFLKDYQAAIDNFSKTIELNSNFADAYNSRGNSYHFINDPENACKDWMSAYEKGYYKSLPRLKKYCNYSD